MKLNHYILSLSLCLASTSALAIEYPIGKPNLCGGMEIAAVYLQPIEMEPANIMRLAAKSDIHLEADIHALEDNKNGFQEGNWMPYLQVTYELTKQGNDSTLKGHLHPMVANDGPHYGDNIKLFGAGNYHLKFTVLPPSKESMFGRHVDKETGVAPWFTKCVSEYDFTYAGTGKKGGY
ncbi:Periplasmic protein p19 [Liberibacter crescens BT-1]|uniref:Periplasmic protein p19 n=1 Tax=Liberibacter crescens (strain BT-1) TaxID=1215343 RepID=L0EX19_LIBCB|nr:iron transporter [Liberibacter crescens]AGA64921.1 Periplasmic protein p19 [Liberibacter crescens BT-1]AMC12946.1 membrane protein [Liberibacter crescens]